MFLTVTYDGSGKLTRVTRTLSKPSDGQRAVVAKCPREVYSMSTDEIKDNMRVRDVQGRVVELEYGRR